MGSVFSELTKPPSSKKHQKLIFLQKVLQGERDFLNFLTPAELKLLGFATTEVNKIYETCMKRMDEILSEVERRVEGLESPKGILKEIRQALADLGYRVSIQPLLSKGLADKVLDCDTFTMIFVEIGKQLGFPIHYIALPGHVVARWDDGKKRANLETTIDPSKYSEGKPSSLLETPFRSDKTLLALHNLTYTASQKTMHIKNLKEDEMLALHKLSLGSLLSDNLGRHYAELGDYEKAEKKYREALAFYEECGKSCPKSESLYIKKALTLTYMEEYEEALEYYNKAMGINPNYERLYLRLAFTYSEMGLLDEAKESSSKAWELMDKKKKAAAQENKLLSKPKKVKKK